VTLALVGDSYMGQWESAVDEIARRNGIRVVGYYKNSCPWTTAAVTGRQGSDPEVYSTCQKWSRDVAHDLLALKPDLVLTTQWTDRALSVRDDPTSRWEQAPMTEGVLPLWTQIRDAEIPLAVLGRNPARAYDEPSIDECVAHHREDLGACTFEPDLSVAEWQQGLVATFGSGASYFDLNPLICSPRVCPAVIDGVLVYRAQTHLTRTFVDTLTDPLEAELLPLLGME
jgi:hypothetical protein